MIGIALYSTSSLICAFYVHYRYHEFNLTPLEARGGSG